MRINHNMSAIKANTNIARSDSTLSRSLERLSSGYKINRAADNAAGLAISQKMHTQIRGLDQASTNASDGISVIQTAEGALNEVENILQRMRELSVQAANDTNTTNDRAAIQAEIDQLREEIDRIAGSTEFNTKKLLDGSADNRSYSDNNNVTLISVSDSVEIKEYALNVLQDARQAVLVGSGVDTGDVTEEEAGTLIVNGLRIPVSEGQTIEQVYENIRNACDTINVSAFFSDGNIDTANTDNQYAGYTAQDPSSGGSLTFVTKEYGSEAKLKVYCENENLRSKLGIGEDGATAQGVDVKATLGDGFRPSATADGNGCVVTVTDTSGFKMQFKVKPGSASTQFQDANLDGTEAGEPTGTEFEVGVTVLPAGPLDLQIGANEDQVMEVRIPRVNCETLEIQDLNVCTSEGAQNAISIADKAIEQVSAIRAKLGAYQNRLDHAVANLDTSEENLTDAMSRITDTDMAEEMTNYTQYNVLVQAGVSMLTQANQRPQTILSLLQS
ncbi:MAG: flagellar biosynthesis protein FlgL [Lachnospiraceae bacterium]|nr:flagellar biosynthesis protein FlgL [Lachnospiraceae bacterium]